MEQDNKFKLKLPRIFTSSCKTQDLSEVIDHQNPIFTPQTPLIEIIQHEIINNNNISLQQQQPSNISHRYKDNNISLSNEIKPKFTPSLLPSSSSSSSSSMMYCKPRCPETFDQMVRENCIIATAGNPFSRRKIAGKYSLLSPLGEFSGGGRRCPPASPATPLFSSQKQGRKLKKTKKKRSFKGQNWKNESALLKKIENPDQILYYSSNESDFDDFFSSDDEGEFDETETLFSLKSLSFSSKSISFSSDDDDDSVPAGARTRTQARRRKVGSGSRPKPRKESGGGGGGVKEEVGVVPLEGKVKDTFAVVKSSSDPYNDFRTSMVEMIIEKQIFGAKELEQLLQCFLSLNSPHHHSVIVEVFTEIWEALFSHCS